MSFKLGNKNKPVTVYTVNFKDGSTVEFKLRKPTTSELLEMELDVNEFNSTYVDMGMKVYSAYQKFEAKRKELEELEKLSEEELETKKEQLIQLSEQLNELMNEIKDLQVFQKPQSLANVKAHIKNFIVGSKGILDQDDKEYDFVQLPEESQNEVMDAMPLEDLKTMLDTIKESVSLSPLE